MTVVAVLASAEASAQAVSSDSIWGGDGDYRDLWVPPENYRYRTETSPNDPFPRGTAPRQLDLSFDADSNCVLVEWKPPRFVDRVRMTRYQLRMKREGSRQWGRWQEVGPVKAAASSVVIHSVDPGSTYEIQVRARNDRIAGPSARSAVTIPGAPPPS